jgi:hypothetical protein
MLCWILRKDQDVVKEYDDKLVHVAIEHVVHGRLECGRCIGKSKGHYLELVMSIACAKRCLVDVLLCNPNLPKS